MEQTQLQLNEPVIYKPFINTIFNEKNLANAWTLLLLAVICNLIIFLIHLIQLPVNHLVQFIYDDGFYYLVIAKNFYQYHHWTFDGGLTLTSGFQPLFAYCLLGLYALFKPNLMQFIYLSLCFTGLITTLSFIWITKITMPHKWSLIAATALIASSLNFAYDAITLVEWPLLVFIAASYFVVLYQIKINIPIWRSAMLLAILGCLGSFTRIDFGAMPLSLCFIAFTLLIMTKKNHYFLLTLSGLMGACLGVLLVFLHNYYFTGHLLQNSATMKLLWEQVSGPSPYSFFAQLMSLILGNFYRDAMPTLSAQTVLLFPKLLLLAILALSAKAFFSFSSQLEKISLFSLSHQQEKISSISFSPSGRRKAEIEGFHKNFLVIAGSIITIIFYCIFYSFNTGALQPWYSGNAIVPMIILVTAILNLFQTNLIRYSISFILLISIAIHMHHLYTMKITPWASQKLLYETGSYLQQTQLPGKIGSWNAGIISYFEGQHIINLDGLMNDEIYPYAKNNNLECYFIKKQINYIADFTAMFNDYHKARGGYSHNLQDWLIPIAAFKPTTAESAYAAKYHHSKLLDVEIFKVNLQGLSENNQCF